MGVKLQYRYYLYIIQIILGNYTHYNCYILHKSNNKVLYYYYVQAEFNYVSTFFTYKEKIN